MPGQSEFYSVEKTLLYANFSIDKYWSSLQVSPHPQFGYRPKIGEYFVNKTIKVEISKIIANPHHGTGGGWQVFVHSYAENISLNREIPLKR